MRLDREIKCYFLGSLARFWTEFFVYQVYIVQFRIVSSFFELSILKKLSFLTVILTIPVVILFDMYVETANNQISFTKKEIAGSQYLEMLQGALDVMTADPSDRARVSQLLSPLKTAESQALQLGILSSAQGTYTTATENGAEIVPDDAIAKISDLISQVSDASNITLDPDADTYFVGDIVVDQTPEILRRASALARAAAVLDSAGKTDDRIVAYAEARDGLALATSTLDADLAKPLKATLDPGLATELGGVSESAATTGAAAQSFRRVASGMVSRGGGISANLNTFIVAIRAI